MFFRVGTVLCISAQTTLSTSMRKWFAAWSMSETCFPSWGIESKAIQVNRAQIAEKKLAKTKTIITSPYYNSLKVLDFYQK